MNKEVPRGVSVLLFILYFRFWLDKNENSEKTLVSFYCESSSSTVVDKKYLFHTLFTKKRNPVDEGRQDFSIILDKSEFVITTI